MQELDVTVVGVSVDDQAKNAAFRKENDLPFTLLCDEDRKVAMAYGAADTADARFARRIAVLIAADGRVEQRWDRVKVRSFATDVLEVLAASSTSEPGIR